MQSVFSLEKLRMELESSTNSELVMDHTAARIAFPHFHHDMPRKQAQGPIRHLTWNST